MPELPSDPDYVSGNHGEHLDIGTDMAPTKLICGKREFAIEYDEQPNGVWHASSEVVRSTINNVYFPVNTAPDGFKSEDEFTEYGQGSDPHAAYSDLKSKLCPQ